MAIVRGLTRDGKEVFYTGRAGDAFVSPDRFQAFECETIATARERAKRFNRYTEIHGIHFIGIDRYFTGVDRFTLRMADSDESVSVRVLPDGTLAI
jgi:hypothetical protein